jgi:hypothetical protein
LLASIEAHFERHFKEVESPSSEAVEAPVSPAVPLAAVAAFEAGKIHESNQVQPIAYFHGAGRWEQTTSPSAAALPARLPGAAPVSQAGDVRGTPKSGTQGRSNGCQSSLYFPRAML